MVQGVNNEDSDIYRKACLIDVIDSYRHFQHVLLVVKRITYIVSE